MGDHWGKIDSSVEAATQKPYWRNGRDSRDLTEMCMPGFSQDLSLQQGGSFTQALGNQLPKLGFLLL